MAELALYECKVINSSSHLDKALFFASDTAELFALFKEQGVSVISISKKKTSIRKPIEDFSLPFFKSLYPLVSNNIDIITSLNIIQSSFQSQEMKAIVANIIQRIMSGSSLSNALSKFDRYFDLLIVKTIEISERTAGLPEAIGTIIKHLEVNTAVQNEIKNSTRYPIILLIVIAFVTIFWIFFIVPVFSELFADIGIKMPLITRIVIKFRSLCLNHYFAVFLLLSAVAAYFVAVFKYNAWPGHKPKIQKMIPLIGTMRRDSVALNFFSGMHVMLKEKINLLDALDCVSMLTSSKDVATLNETIRRGNSLSQAMRYCRIFKNSEVAIIEAGERAGDLWAAFQAAEEMLRAQVSTRSKKIISLIQPLTVLFIGGLMLIVVYSVMIPMYSQLEMPG